MKSNTAASILVINCGSSSLKFRLIRMPEEQECAGGEAVRVGTQGTEPSAIRYHVGDAQKEVIVPLPDHATAFRKIIGLLKQEAVTRPDLKVDCFAHRYVHPGTQFTRTSRIDPGVFAQLKKTIHLAPIHNIISLDLIAICSQEFAEIPQFAVFDTAFHSTIPAEYASYALPESLVKKYQIRKIGFHGISHRYVMEESCRILDREPAMQKIISCHLGSGGSSICAIQNGRSLNNSMGFTPLAGLMMNTRCGDLDIGVLLHVMAENNYSPDETEHLLNYKSGILGVFSNSSDIRDVAKQLSDDEKAKIAFEMYVRRVRKYIGYYSILLKKADILVFTDTLGVEMPALRRSICDGMDCFGIRLDTARNETSAYRNADVTGGRFRSENSCYSDERRNNDSA